MVSSQPTHTTQTTKVELPAWVDSASQANVDVANQIAAQPFMQYAGNRVADMNDSTKSIISGLKTQLGPDNANSQTLADIASGKISVANTDLSKYMNPYTDEVVNKSLGAMNDQRVQALMANADAAQKANAFGGSRHGVVDAVTTAQSLKDQGLLASQLYSSGYDKATGLAGQDISNRASAATAGIDANTKNLAAAMQTGLMEKTQNQSVIDSDIAKFNEPRNRDIENLNLRLSALGMSPYGKTETADKTTTGGSSGTDWAQAGLGVFSLLLGLSDDDEKTDKKRIGTLPGTDLGLWAFRYKGDPKHYPKSVGVMASEVEKKVPSAVHRVPGGPRVVDYGLLEQVMHGGN